MKDNSPENELADFIAKYTPEIATLAKSVLAKMRKLLPNAILLVYDNYNALAIGFSPTERASDVIFSIALYPRWINFFFLKGINLPDPQKLLKGNGKVVRHIVLKTAEDLDNPDVKELMTQALTAANKPIDDKTQSRIIIKSVSAKQRSRQPVKPVDKK